MEAVSLTKHFRSADKTWFTAVDGASISLQKGKTLGLLGQSGSGKSTLGQMMVGLLKPDSGELFFHGKLLSLSHSRAGTPQDSDSLSAPGGFVQSPAHASTEPG